MTSSLEALFRIWIDATGECVEVGADSDGLDMAEIRYRDNEGKPVAEIRLGVEHLPVLIEALQRFHAFVKERAITEDTEPSSTESKE